MMYKLAIFDLDGTILNTLEDLSDSTNYALRKHNYPERTIDEVRQFVGNGIRKLIERAVPASTKVSDIDKVHKTFTEHYNVHCKDKTKEYDGISEMLKKIRENGMLTAVVSNKADVPVQILCKDYFDGLFDFTVGQREGIAKKPSPDSVNEVLRVLGVNRKDAVYIGDSDVDVKTAENAMMDSIIVEWGFRKKDFLIKSGAKTFAHDTKEIYDILNGKKPEFK